jgi:hypothetical protein
LRRPAGVGTEGEIPECRYQTCEGLKGMSEAIYNLKAVTGRVAVISRVRVVLLAFVLALSALSCGIFDTRDSEPPGGGGTVVPREEPVTPDAVIFNFESAVAYFSEANYDEVLASDFSFTPDEEDQAFFASQGNPDIFKNWGKNQEITAVRKIFADSESLTVVFSERDRTPGAVEVMIRMDYAFRRVISRGGSAGDSVVTFRGLAYIHLRSDASGFWAIDEWEEFRTPQGDQTWGRLKGNVTAG